MNISIVIPNYNGAHLLRANLEDVVEAVENSQKYIDVQAEIIIHDDASHDESMKVLEELQEKFKKRIVIHFSQNEKNYGFSTTVNRGVKKAKGEIVILLNTDVKPEKDFLQALLSHFSDPDVFAVACMDKSIEDGKTVLRGRGIGRWERGFLVHAAGKLDNSNTLWASGGSSAFRKTVWQELEGLNESYNPFYWEDIDLSYRAQKSGYKIIFDPKSIVIHEHEKGAIKSKYSPQDVKKIAYRNQFIFVWSNVTDGMLFFQHIAWLPYHMLKAIIKIDWMFFYGFINAVIMLPQILSKRRKSKKLFKKSDRSLQIFS